MCSAYTRIAKSCHPQIWEPRLLVRMLCSERPCLPLIQSIQAAIAILTPSYVLEGEVDTSTSVANLKSSVLPQISSKRSMEINSTVECKRQKTSDFLVDIEEKKKFANELKRSICLFLESAKPASLKASTLKPETNITALSLLCLSFSAHPHSSLSSTIFHQIFSWIPWICKQAKDSSLLVSALPTYLQAVHNILCLQDLESREKLFQDDEFLTDVERSSCIYPKYADLLELLKLPWTCNSIIQQACEVGKIKCLCIQVFSKIGPKLNDESDLEVLDLAIHDEDEEVCIEAVTSMPVIVLCSGQIFFEKMLRKLELVGRNTSPKIRRSILFSVAYMSCLWDSPCKLFLGDNYERQICTSDILLSGFCCPHCDKGMHNRAQLYNVISMTMLHRIDFDCDDSFVRFQVQFFEFLYDDSVKEFHGVCIKLLPRILRHSTKDILLKTKPKWNECIDYLVLHKSKGIRDAFHLEISCFIEDSIFDILFSDMEGNSNSNGRRFVDKLNHALTVSEDSEIQLTILKSTAAIMNASDIHRPLFLYSFILIIDQLDSGYPIVKMVALRFLRNSPHFCHKGGLELVLSKIPHIRDGLYEYFLSRLVNHPNTIREFSEAVLGIKVEKLIARIAPFVIPKLVISHKDNNQTLGILHELASHLRIDVVPLIVKWLPKVLAYTLLREDEKELSSVLEFYHVHTGSHHRELFDADLSALLDELLCFSGEGETDETELRTSRIPVIVEEVAKRLTSSDDLPSFLKNHFVGLLNSIDRKMLHSKDLWLQKQALKRIEKLIEMMGPYLSTHVPKIMVLLIYAIDKEALQAEGISVFHFFIRQLAKLSPSSTKHVISQVVAAFIPCLEKCKENPSVHLDKIGHILEDFVVENRLVLEQQIRELPLLPSLPALNKVIQEARGSTSLRDQLQDAVNGLNHESLNVRYMMACELSKLLNLRRDEVTALIADDFIVDLNVISSLISSPLRGCAEESRTAVGQRFKLVCGDCLGALGAIDPAKFQVTPQLVSLALELPSSGC